MIVNPNNWTTETNKWYKHYTPSICELYEIKLVQTMLKIIKKNQIEIQFRLDRIRWEQNAIKLPHNYYSYF